MGGLLGSISHYCKNKRLPWLTSLVVNEETGLPGEGLMELAKREYGEKIDFHAIQSRVFIYDWFKDPRHRLKTLRRQDRKLGDRREAPR